MTSSSYTVPEMEDEEKYSRGDMKNWGDGDNERSMDDMPKFLRHAIKILPTRYKKIWVVIAIVSQLGIGVPMFAYMTSSLIIGTIISICGVIGNLSMIFQPDFTKGVFLDLLLRDSKIAKKTNDNVFSTIIFNFVFFSFIILPLIWYFCIIPFANTKPGMLGPMTFEITIASSTVGSICNIASMVFSTADALPDIVSLVHIDKIKGYLETVRNIILNHNEEDGVPLVDKLSNEQEKVERWILAINNGISTYNTISICICFVFNIVFLSVAGSGISTGITITAIIFSMFFFVYFTNMMYAIAKPNMAWEHQKVLLLNDPKVISAVLLKLKFPKENFESWLHFHQINSARAFGTKITFEKMKQAAGVLTSAFGVALYLLLRQELTSKGIL